MSFTSRRKREITQDCESRHVRRRNEHITHSRRQCHNSKLVIFSRETFKGFLKCYNFLWVRRRHNCSPAASFTNCVMTLYFVKSASANVSFYTNNSKMPNFELWHSCRKWAIFGECVGGTFDFDENHSTVRWNSEWTTRVIRWRRDLMQIFGHIPRTTPNTK